MGVVSKRSRDRLLMAGAAAVSAVAFYFAWKALRSTAALDDENEDGEKELQDLEQLMQTNEEKGAEAACVNSYSEKEQDGFTVEEFEQFVAEEYGKPQAEVTVDPPSNLIEEEEFAVEDFIRTEEDQHGDSRGKFEDSGIPCDGFLEGTHLCLTSPSDEIETERFSMENELQEDNHSVNLIRSGPCIGHDVCDSGLTETIHGISNGISDDSNPLFGDFEEFSSSITGAPLGQVRFDCSSNSCGTQGIPSEDFVTEFCSSRDAGYDELSTQKVVMFLGNGVQACDLKNQPDGQNASEFHQTSIDDKGISCEGPVTELSDVKDVGELAGHLSDDGQHHNHKVAVSEEPSDVGIALEHELDSSVNKGMECLRPQEGLDTESSNSSDDACNEHSSDNDSESSTVENCEHADRETTTVYSEKPLDESERHLLDDSLKSVSIKNRDHVGYQIAADSEKSFDGQIVLQAELGNISKNEKMGDLNSVAPLSEVSYSAHNGCDELSSHLLEDGIPS